MQTNKQFQDISDGRDNCQAWNEYLSKEKMLGEGTSWYSATWMWTECYMYRRVLEAMTNIEQLRDFDFFRHQKEEGFRDSLYSMEQLGEWILQILPEDSSISSKGNDTQDLFAKLLQISLWGNKCDLSISAGNKRSATGNAIDQLESLKERILVDQTSSVWESLEDSNQIVDIVMDNAGYELFTDLCLADFLISSGKACKVRFRIKEQPWFVSDTTIQDFNWTLNILGGEKSDNHPSLFTLGERWQGYMRSGEWTVTTDPFWTYPHVYSELETTDPQLHSTLAEAKLVIFKGDLNYRKLVGDLNWETTVPFKTSLQGFNPTNILSLRTLKADVVTGLEAGQAENLYTQDKEWMVNGNWGVIQFAPR